jgi:predicted RNase H-like nuclease (RuvC/YqgF family)
MPEDLTGRLKEKTLQIASLNQRIETLQAQLEGSQRRTVTLGEKIASLERALANGESENGMLRNELSNARAALDSVGKEIQGIRAEQTQLLSKKRPTGSYDSLKDELSLAQMTIDRLRGDLKQLSEAGTSAVSGEAGALETLKAALLEVGDPQYRILNMVLGKGSAGFEEIASALVISTSDAAELVGKMQVEGEVEIRSSDTVIPGKKYREITVPRDEWTALEAMQVFARLEEFVGRTDDQETIVRALETAVEILEQKLARGGALIFQMRRTADAWRKQQGSVEELKYAIREWAGRAQALG